MARLDSYAGYPEDMAQYLSFYGWHFSEKMCKWAVSRMYRKNNGRKVPIDPITKDKFDDMLRQYAITLDTYNVYDPVYIANMCKADYFGTSVRSEADLVQYVKDTVDDPDGYDGMPFTRFYADCIGSGIPIDWKAMM